VVLQAAIGVANIGFGAPPAVQVLHLAVANAVWIALVYFYATAMAGRRNAAT